MTRYELSLLERDLRHAHRSLHQRYINAMGLYYGQPILLVVLNDRGSCTQKELAEELNISTAAVATSVKRMEKAGLLQKERDREDQRINHVCLTAEGARLAKVCMQSFQRIDQTQYDGFSDEELSQLANFYARMLNNLRAAARRKDEEEM